MAIGHGLDDHSVLYRDKTFVSSMSGLAVGPTLHPVVCKLGVLSLLVIGQGMSFECSFGQEASHECSFGQAVSLEC